MTKINSITLVTIIHFFVFIISFGNETRADEKMKIYADEININDIDETIEAYGDAIAINESDNIKIKSDKIFYDRNDSILNAKGNIIINDELQNVFFLDEIVSKNNLEEINGNKFRARLNDESRVVGKKYIKNKEINILTDAEFTPCKRSDYLIENCPGWKMKAKNIYQNNASKTIYYDHARIHLFNVPIFYLPYFSHPDPSVKKRTGFLMPTIQTDNRLGETLNLPFFVNIKSNQDFTLTPNIQTKSNNFYSLNYRHLNNYGNFNIDSSIDDNGDGDGSSSHFFYSGNVINPYGNLNTFFQVSNNDTYMRKNKINNLTILRSGINFSRGHDNTFFSLNSLSYKHLTRDESQQWEYMVPKITYNISDIENNFFNGDLSLNNQVSVNKHFNNNYTTLASSELEWRNAAINNKIGVKSNNEFNLRIVSTSIDRKNGKDSNNVRFYPQFSTKLSYPLIKNSNNYNQTLMPVLMPIIAPYNNYTNNQSITNSNLFSKNRATSLSEWESGPRVNYGVEWYLGANNGASSRLVIGQNYRINKEDKNQSEEISNYFITSNISMNANNYINSSLIIDRNDLDVKNLNVNSFNKVENLTVALDYDYASGKYTSPEQIAIGGKYNFQNNLTLKFTGKKNLDTNKNIGYQYGLLYENDCLGIDFNYYRDLTKDRDIDESYGYSFTIVLKPFGTTNQYGKYRVFGPQI